MKEWNNEALNGDEVEEFCKQLEDELNKLNGNT